VNAPFFKFPSTPHLIVSGKIDVRNDKILSDIDRVTLLQNELVIEEKIDGANLGISFDANGNIMLQNRGSLVIPPYIGQWKKFPEWLSPRLDNLFDVLTDRYILFGEWCYAKHSIEYTKLPDWFVGFDIFDKQTGRFFSCQGRDMMFQELSIAKVPQIAKGVHTLQELMGLMSISRFGDSLAEGVYMRHDKDKWLVQRVKLVNPVFSQIMGEHHWFRNDIQPNRRILGYL